MGVSWISGVVVLVFLFCSSGAEVQVKIENVNVHAAHDLLRKGYRYLDVRTEEEFNKGHVKNKKFMNQVLSSIAKEERVVVGCKIGVRSEYATEDLLKAGFKHVCNMEGGYDAWVKKGFPVDNQNKTEL